MKKLERYLNSFSVYCWLRRRGLSDERATWCTRLWEKIVHPIIYSRGSAPLPITIRTKDR